MYLQQTKPRERCARRTCTDVLKQVKASHSAHMDETGHRRDGMNQWLWGMISESAVFFSIEPSRGKKVIDSLKGTYTNPKLRIVRFCTKLLTLLMPYGFIFNERVEPTNNHAEQGLRPAVIWRKKLFWNTI